MFFSDVLIVTLNALPPHSIADTNVIAQLFQIQTLLLGVLDPFLAMILRHWQMEAVSKQIHRLRLISSRKCVSVWM
jgi:hypothetical protein